MALTALSIRNFRAFSRETRFELASITLLVGPNNSGKSSVTRALHLLQATARTGEFGRLGDQTGVGRAKSDTGLRKKALVYRDRFFVEVMFPRPRISRSVKSDVIRVASLVRRIRKEPAVNSGVRFSTA